MFREKSHEVLWRQRFAHQIALYFVAPQIFEEADVIVRFDTFCNHRQAQRMTKADHGFDYFSSSRSVPMPRTNEASTLSR